MIYEILKELNINYEEVEHKPFQSFDEAEKVRIKMGGVGAKNLFLKNKDSYYLVLMTDGQKANLKEIEKQINSSHLSFVSKEELKEILNLDECVTPLGIINDKDNKVTILIDKTLIDKELLCHPLINTKTIKIKYNDLIKYIEHFNHKYLFINI